jgi:(E)-4-hydroxy-3-methylbut-2-enyl-diphosphate synthase
MVGGGAPIVVQSMTNTDTADVDGTVAQVAALARAGSEIVRITVDRDEAAAAVPRIRERLDRIGVTTPLVGDFHYIGHQLLADHPACAQALAKYRINPGNVGFKEKKDASLRAIVEQAIRLRQGGAHTAPTGARSTGAAHALMTENCRPPASARGARGHPRGDDPVGAALGRPVGRRSSCPRDRIILSAQVRPVQDLIAVSIATSARRRSDYAIHLRPHRGPACGSKGNRRLHRPRWASCSRPAIGDHDPGVADPERAGEPHDRGQGRAGTAADDGLPHLRAARRRLPGLRPHHLDVFQELAQSIQGWISTSMPEWKRQYPGVEALERRR